MPLANTIAGVGSTKLAGIEFDADARLFAVVGRPLPGSPNDGMA
ncbi:hypothetical protein [Streptomyces sp. NBC_01428]|nr:hypothetical protein [Streptomyces sp. NBC_01428]